MAVADKERYWKILPAINQKTGEFRQRYSFRRVPAKRIPIISPTARQFAGYVLIERDLRMVIQWLTNVAAMSSRPKGTGYHVWTDKDDESHNQALGLFVAALTFYGKCFSECEGRRVQLDKQWIPTGFEEAHELMLTMRNNFAAHSGAEKFEDVQIVLVLPAKKGKLQDEPRLYRELKQTESLISHHDDDASFLQLATRLQTKVLEKLDELNARLFEKEIRPLGWDHWLSKEMY
jgi:hypothetical protein